MRVKSCEIQKNPNNSSESCREENNLACSHGGAPNDVKEVCVDTETTQLEWSDVTVFFQFGFQLRTGIVRKTYHNIHTADWVGPYNMILAPIEKRDKWCELARTSSVGLSEGPPPCRAPQKQTYVSRYVATPWTDSQLQRPFASSAIFNFDSGVLEDVAGTTAINATIRRAQRNWRGDNDKDDDPYAKHSRSCSQGDLTPILPRLEITRDRGSKTTKPRYSMKLDYSVLSLPVPGIDDLYKLWPKIKKHLGPAFPLRGPYCYGNDPNRGYAMHLSYDSTEPAEAATWKGVKGCVPPWPCWKSEPHSPALPPSSVIPTDNHSEGSYVLDPMGVEFAIVYAIGFLLVVSLVFNCQLANRLKGMQQHSSSSGRLYRPVPAGGPEAPSASSSSDPSQLRVASGGSGGLEEPLLSPTTPANGERRGRQSSQRPSPPAVEESKEEAADP